MLIPLLADSDLRRVQRKLLRVFKAGANESELHSIATRAGATGARPAYWHDADGVWGMISEPSGKPEEYWNPVGIERPVSGRPLSNPCQLNPMTSRNSRRGALYVLDDQTGHDIILHTGMMGGGTRGFTRDVFQDNYVGPVARVQGFENTFAQVADIDGSEPLAEICSFATEARRIKQLIRAEEEAAQSTPRSRTLFTAYETKRLKTRRTPQVEPGEVDLVHDPVTNALDAAIREFGYQPMEDADRGGTHDLLLRKPKSILFEVKTTLGVQDAYTAVGQLLLNGSRLRPSPSLVYVCPAPPLGTRPWYFGAFNRLGIQIVTYTSVDGEPRVNHRQLGRVLPPS